MDASYFDQNTDLASPKSEVCKFDVVKPKTVPTDLSKWSNRVDNNVVKKTVYDGLVKRRNAINSEKQNLEKRIKDVDKKIPDISKYTENQNLNRSTKTNVNAIKAEASKNLVTKH